MKTKIVNTEAQRHREYKCLCSGHFRDYVTPLLVMILLVTVTFGFSSRAFAVGGDVVWEYGDTPQTEKQDAESMAVDSNGNTIIVGFTSQSGNDDFYTVKMNAAGTAVVWSKTHDRSGGNDYATAVAIDSDDNVIVVGYTWNGTDNDIHVMKYNASDGAVLWHHDYDGAAGEDDYATVVAIDSLNNIYVGGKSENASANEDYLILKYATGGATPVWEKTYNGLADNNDSVTAIIAGIDGIAVTGKSENATPDYDCVTIKYDFDGNLTWEKRKTVSGNDEGDAVGMDSSGNVIMAGITYNGSNKDIYIAKYNSSNGNVLWEDTYDGGNTDEPTDLVVDSFGDAFITGYTYVSGTNDFFTAKYASSDGNQDWTHTFSSAAGDNDRAVGIAVDESGDVFVTGDAYDDSLSNYNYFTIKLAKSGGTLLWQKSYDGTNSKDDRVVGVGLSSAGQPIVAGCSDMWTSGATDYDYYAVKYDPGLLNSPTSFSATVASISQINLAWTDNASNEDGFKIERKIGDAGSFAQITTVGANVTTYNNTGLSSDTKYYYRVKAYNAGDGDSHYTNEDYAVTTILSLGAPSITFVYNGAGDGDDFALAIDAGPDNIPVVTGYSLGSTGGNNYYTVKLNKDTLAQVWNTTYDGDLESGDYAESIVVDNSNKVIVNGYSKIYSEVSGLDTDDIYTVKYPSTGGSAEWFIIYDPIGKDDRSKVVNVAVDGSNNYVATGYGRNASNNEDIFVIKYLSNGTQAWAATPYDGSGAGHDYPSDVAFDSSGNIFVTGYVNNGTDTDYFTRKINGSTGVAIWTKVYNIGGSGNDQAKALAIDSSDNVIVTGYALTATGDDDFYTIKYDGTDGTLLWEKSFNGLENGVDDAIAIKVDPYNDDVVVAGTTDASTGNYEIHVIRYDIDGTKLWERTIDRVGSNDYAVDMAMDTSGNVYIVADSETGGDNDIFSVSYDYAGTYRGGNLYDGAAGNDDYVEAITINDLGEVYVTGYEYNASNNTDYLVYKIAADDHQAPYPFTASSPDFIQIDLSWSDNATTEDGYRIERKIGTCSSANSWGFLTNAVADATSYSNTGVSVGTTYCYKIRAYKDSGEVSRWHEASASTATPTAPGSFSAITTNTTQINLSWTDNTTGETGFKVERCSGASCEDFVQIDTASANATSYSDTSICNNTSYSYRVAAYKTGEWNSAFSNDDTAVTTSLSAPTVLSVTRASEVQINLSWTDNTPSETGFSIERCSGASCSDFAEIATVGMNVTTYNNSGLTYSTDYTYRVKAYKTATCSWNTGYTNEDSATTTIAEPSSLSASTINTTQINLVWTDNTDSETGFEIERCTGASCSNFASLTSVSADATSYSDTSVCENVTYNYQVRANRNATWYSGYSNDDETATNAKSAPTVMTATKVSEVQIDLSWIDNTNDETGFKIERCAGAGCSNFTDFATVGSSITSYNNTGLTHDTTYKYRVKAYKTATCNWETAYSNDPEATTTLNGPTVLDAATFDSTRIDLSWTDNTVSETGFKIERCTGASCTITDQIATVGVNVTSYSDTSVCENTTYNYRVRANKDTTWDSNYSNEDETATNVKSAPTSMTATRISEVQVDLAWTDNTNDETGFKIQRCAGAGCSNFAEIADVGANVTSYNNTGLTSGTTYNYRIQAYKTATCSWTIDSNTSQAEATIIEPSDFTIAVMNTSQIDLEWTDNTVSETGFKIERCAGASCSDFAQTDTVTADETTYSDVSACENITYRYRIRAYLDGVWDSIYSSEQETTTDAKGLPFGLTDEVMSEFQIDLLWTDASYDEAGFELQKCTGAAAACTEDVDFTYTTDVSTDTDAVAYWAFNRGTGVIVYDRVFISNGTVTGATWTTGKTGGGMSFNGSSDYVSTTYNLDQGGTKSFTFEAWVYPLSTSAGEHHVISTDNGGSDWSVLRDGGTWYVYNGTSSWSTGESVDINQWQHLVVIFEPGTGVTFYKNNGTPVTTAVLTYDASDNIVNIGRNPASGAYFDGKIDEVAIHEKVMSTMEVAASYANGAPLTHRHSDSGLSPGTTFTYRVKVNKSSSCSWLAYTNVKETTTLAPPAPTDLAVATINTTQIDLSWADNTVTEDGFKIERCTGTGCSSWAQIDTVGVDVDTYSDISACENLTYNYRVRAYKTSEWDSAYTNEDETATNVKAVPTVLSATRISEVQINLSWTDNTGDETGFKIERCTGPSCSSWAQIDTVGANVTTYNDTGLTHETDYNYRVRAYKTALCPWDSDYTNSANAVTTITVPGSLSATTINTTQIDLSWTDNTASETGFKIERCTGASCSIVAQIDTVGVNATSYSDVTVCENITYNYRVRANKGATWDSGYSNEDETTVTAKAAPTVLSATRISEVQINLSWTDNTGDETGFKIERCAGPSCSSWAQIDTVGANVTTYNDTGLTHETDYNYRVRAYKTALCPWDSDYTNSANAVTTITVPGILSATTINTTQIDLSWTDNTASETGFKIERCTGASCSIVAQIDTVGVNATSYSDVTVCENTTYNYRVRANKGATWDSGYSNEDETTATAKVAPTMLSATRISEVQINLSWTDNTGDETGFKIERCAGSSCVDFAQITTVGGNVTTYNNTGLTYSTEYSYRVRAYKTASCDWDSDYSNTDSATTSITDPSSLTATTINTTQINLAWTDNAVSESGFKIERCTGAGCSNFTQVDTVGSNVTSYSDTSVCNTTEYNYQVRAYVTSEWDSGYTNTDSATTTSLSAPDSISAATVSYTQIDLAWADNMSDETGFKLERCAGAGCSDFTQITAPGADATSYNDTSISPSTDYCYRVRTYKTATCGWDSGYTSTSCATSQPTTPTTLAANADSSTEITLTWVDNAGNEDGYEIEVQIFTGEFVKIASVGPGVTTFTDGMALQASTVYTYRVRAFNGPDKSPYSNEASATTPAYDEADDTCSRTVPLPAPTCLIGETIFNLSEDTGSLNASDSTNFYWGVVSDPGGTILGDGYFHGDGSDNYIDFDDDTTCLKATTALTLEARIKVSGVAGTGDTVQRIFDRTGSNYQMSIWRKASWDPPFAPPSGVAVIAFWMRVVDAHSAATWKIVMSDYDLCPIVDDHLYKVKMVWNTNKAGGAVDQYFVPADLYVEDQGTSGTDTPGYTNCTDVDQSQVLDNNKLFTNDSILSSDSTFHIGVNASGNNKFLGLIDWIKVKDTID